MHPDAHQAKCGNTVYQISILELNLSLNVTLRWIFYAVSGREEIRGLWGGEGGMDGDGEKAVVGGLGDWQGVATQRFAA